MSDNHADMFRELFYSNTHKLGCDHFYFVTGSNIEKTKEQMPTDILDLADGVFTCLGNELWISNNLIYRRDIDMKLLSRSGDIPMNVILESHLDKSEFPLRTGNHLEYRDGGVLNFSIVGRNATHEERYQYSLWDKKTNERASIVAELKDMYPDFEFSAGGEISIDITKYGCNKSQILKDLRIAHGIKPIYFFGDKMTEDGNDYPLRSALEKETARSFTINRCFNVGNPEVTFATLNRLATY